MQPLLNERIANLECELEGLRSYSPELKLRHDVHALLCREIGECHFQQHSGYDEYADRIADFAKEDREKLEEALRIIAILHGQC